MHATLQPALSVGRSVGRLVGRSVGRSHFTFFFMILLLLPPCSCPNCLVTSNMAPAHPHAISVAVYPALFFNVLPTKNMSDSFFEHDSSTGSCWSNNNDTLCQPWKSHRPTLWRTMTWRSLPDKYIHPWGWWRLCYNSVWYEKKKLMRDHCHENEYYLIPLVILAYVRWL